MQPAVGASPGSAVRRIHGSLMRRITTGELAPGTRLREEEVARRHGVSRTPVREAFRSLEAQGLVTVLPRAGVQVSDISLSEIDELFEIRGALEVLAAQRAARNIDGALADRLRRQLRKCAVAAKAADVDRLASENERLHGLMYEAARSPQLVRLIDALGTRLHRFRVASLSSPERPSRALREHSALVAAIVARDVPKARTLAMEHAEQARIAATRWYIDHHRVPSRKRTGGRS